MTKSEQITEQLLLTAYMVGATLPNEIAAVMAKNLARYPLQWVLGALAKCQMELKTSRLAPIDIISRFDDGRPSPDEAWSMVSGVDSNSEGAVLWTDGEMNVAWGIVRFEIDRGEHVHAGISFKDKYKSLVAEAREEGRPVKWICTGDAKGMETLLPEAVRLGRIPRDYACMLLRHMDPEVLDRLLPAPAGEPVRTTPRLVYERDEEAAAAQVQDIAKQLARRKSGG